MEWRGVKNSFPPTKEIRKHGSRHKCLAVLIASAVNPWMIWRNAPP